MHRITCQPFRALHEAISVSGGEKLPPIRIYSCKSTICGDYKFFEADTCIPISLFCAPPLFRSVF